MKSSNSDTHNCYNSIKNCRLNRLKLNDIWINQDLCWAILGNDPQNIPETYKFNFFFSLRLKSFLEWDEQLL
ncbi:unnamed protein product [Paramecium octaurelia]|uniref:Uncharacterized protein n=1 Tax=Paramecium octaurelia TaxID=43137 RepID=A0A8S1WK53_PAROT|nr:unnamed protein product [Paramecium octaurelia]